MPARFGGLEAVVQTHTESVEARFYLGICLLLTNDRAAGMAQLLGVINAGDAPYLGRLVFIWRKQ